MKENKALICDKILELLESTREKNAIEKINYVRRPNNDEFVEIYYTWQLDLSKPERVVCVTGDSGIALIHDVYSRVYRDLI